MINPVAFTIDIGSFVKDIYWYGIIIAVGMLLAMLLAIRNGKKLGQDPDAILDYTIFLIVFSIIGARIHYVVWSWDLYRDAPLWKIFAIWEGGLAIYGGIITGAIVAFIFSRFRNISFRTLADITVPSLILGQAIGRWGNFANQEAYGYQITNEKFMHFPIAVFIQKTGAYHWATFFYESMWNLLAFFIIMLYMRRPNKKEGRMFYIYLVFYGLGRLIIEGMRTDSQMLFNTGIRINQLISGIIMILGLGLLVFSGEQNEYQMIDEEEDDFEQREQKQKTRDEKKQKRQARKHNIEDMTKESVVDEYKAVTDEMRKQREQELNRE